MRLLLVVALVGIVGVKGASVGQLLNKKVERKIDITSHLVKTHLKITLENPSGQTPASSFHLLLTPQESKHLAYMSVQSGGAVLSIAEGITQPGQGVLYKVDFKDVLQPGKAVSVEVEQVLTGLLEPYPATIAQGEKQLVRYSGNHYLGSPYATTTQTTTVTLPSPNLESYSRLKPTAHTDTTITYGPYDAVAPFSKDPLNIHYENNSPFLTVTRLERLIEVSHWGNIAVEETIDVLHTGARLRGSFSRYDYQREHNTYSSIKSFKTLIPASAKDVYYRDEIGNISTSHMRIQEDAVELDLRPRFPLFGGWKTHYKIGYNVPSYEYLYNSGDDYTLKMRIVDHVFDDVAIDEVKLVIILPEGVRNIKLETPYPVTRLPDTLHHTYLDTVGRTVITVTRHNLVEAHIQDFSLHYQFPAILMLQEPMLVVAAFFLLFLTVIVYVRLDLTLSKDEVTEAKMRVSSHCEQVQARHDSRARLYQRLEEEIHHLKSSKDVAQSQTVTKKILANIRDETAAISDLATRIKVDNAEYAEKVADLQKLDKVVRDSVVQQLSNVEKLVAGKMSKQQYMEADSPLHKKKEETLDKVKQLLANI